jgi:hypothetical protein
MRPCDHSLNKRILERWEKGEVPSFHMCLFMCGNRHCNSLGRFWNVPLVGAQNINFLNFDF